MIRKKRNNKKGFTLVELIVVLVILAILAAILVPALLSWIDNAKKSQDYVDARALMIAIQAQMTEEYGAHATNFSSFDDSEKKFDDIFMTGNPDYDGFMEKACALTGIEKPFLYLFYTKKISGDDVKTKGKEALHEAYTIISAVYWKDKGSKPIFYDFIDNDWKEGSPYSTDLIQRGTNEIQKGSLKKTKVRVVIVGGSSAYVNHNADLSTRVKNISNINDMILKVMEYKGTLNKIKNSGVEIK